MHNRATPMQSRTKSVQETNEVVSRRVVSKACRRLPHRDRQFEYDG